MKKTLLTVTLAALGVVLSAHAVRAQAPSPTGEKEYGNYLVSGFTELGAQFLGTDGNFKKYRSDLNYNRGFRVFNSSFVARSKDNTGLLFDTLRVNTFGVGRDPNKYLRIEAEKTKWYRFDMNYRRFEYFNNLTNLALNQHTSDTVRKFGDFNLTILPQNQWIRFNLGYTFDRDSGRAVSTTRFSSDEFPVSAPTRTVANDYRFGADAKLWIFDVSFLQGLRYSKDDTTYDISSTNVGNNPTNRSIINTFHRELPTRGRLPFTRFSLHTLIKKKVDFTGRYIYTSTTTRYALNERITGNDNSGNTVLLDQFNVTGTAKRPNGIGDIGVSVFVTDKLTISETFRVNNFRINGGDVFAEALFRQRTTPFGTTILPPVFRDSVSFRQTGYRQFLNTVEADYRLFPRLSFHAGYRYTARRVELGELDIPGSGSLPGEREKNHTNSEFFGFKVRPVSIWTVYFDFEHGSADNVFTRVANYDFNNVRVRSAIRPFKSLTISNSLITRDNTNPTRGTTLPQGNFNVDVNNRVFSSTVDWSPSAKFDVSGGYTYSRLSSDTSIIFFIARVLQNGRSFYLMRDHYFFANTRFQLHPRVTAYINYRISKDTGQGDRTPASATEFVTSFPLTFQSPEAKLTVKLQEHVDLNLGWQFYNYKEKFLNNQNYRAHLPYASVRFSF